MIHGKTHQIMCVVLKSIRRMIADVVFINAILLQQNILKILFDLNR